MKSSLLGEDEDFNRNPTWTVVGAEGSLNETAHLEHERVPFPSLFVMPGWCQLLGAVIVAVALALMVTVFKDFFAGDPFYLTQKDILNYASIPLVSIAFTYVHIWAALWMTFYPINFFGCCQIPYTNVGLGWQGIIPFKAESMARKTVKLMTENLIDMEEIFARLDPCEFIRVISPALKPMIRELVGDIATQHSSAEIWEAMPESVKEEVVNQVYEDSPSVIVNILTEFKGNINSLFNLEEMVVSNLMQDVSMLNDIFIVCGTQELKFIRNSGAYMGGIFGLIQMAVWRFFHPIWFLPVFGCVVGTLTNWLALFMIFNPVNPIKLCCFTIQGLFLGRQDEVAETYSKIVAARVLNTDNLITELVVGPTAEKLIPIVHKHVEHAYDNAAGNAKGFVRAALGGDHYDGLKKHFCEGVVVSLPQALSLTKEYTEQSLAIEETLRREMAALSPHEFEQLLHPVFQEDEWKLILMGGVLGALIGVFQTYAL